MQTAITLLLTTVPGWFALLMLAACLVDKLPAWQRWRARAVRWMERY